MFNLIAAFFLLLISTFSSVAQPIEGNKFSQILPLGSGRSIPLPEGQWLVTFSNSIPVPGAAYRWQVTTLKNLDPESPFAALTVRHSDIGVRWSNTACDNQKDLNISFLVSKHGTSTNQLINKCSRFIAIPDGLAPWSNRRKNENNKDWPEEVLNGLGNIPAIQSRNFLQAELTVNYFNSVGIRVDAFLLPPKGVSSVKFKDLYNAGQATLDHQLLRAWTDIAVESIQQSFLDKKSQTLLSLNYKTDLSSGAMASAKTMPAIDTAAQQESEAARDARTNEILRELEKVSPTLAIKPPAKPAPSVPAQAAPVQVASAPPKPPAAVSTPIAPVSAVPSAPSAQEREAKELKAQLDQMRDMLSKLQAANAAATAAANKPPEAPAAAPKPAAAKPIFANRKALIIGNDLYTDVPKLNNAGADADAMAKALEGVGFKVSKYLNLNEKAFKQALRDFRLNIQGGDEVLFFFAGHGVQLGAANYLLPTDIKGDHEEQVKDEGIQLQKVLDDLQEKKTKFALAVIDACRDNPFKGQGRAIGGRGLAPTSAATGQMIMFSAGSGQQALDKLGANDKEKNGLFTRIFLKEMVKPGVSVDRVLRNVRNEVVTLAKGVGHEQTPALYDQAIGEFFFVP